MKKEEFKNIKLLYVEDEALIRENAVEYLSRYFDNVYEAKDGIEALELVREVKPHIIITDINMPNLNGLELAKEIRREDKKTQIIIATAHTDTDYLMEAVELHLVKYMIKPILESKLMPVLKTCISNIKEDVSNIKKLSSNTCFDTFNKTLLVNNEIKKLTKNEILFLELLCINSNRAISYEEIQNYIWYDSYMSGDAIRCLVRALRKKLPLDAIENLSGIGYKINFIN
ncbi:response regulator transcription factor [Poseidonibacter lekithochrous]|uniref:response regulator transcription factor n=1 Tax=Poseidonibacter lekithochrous TaxID=1904463 RepID=UPI0008FC69BF|nr:response regulator [Poseidonibacter lekithochrous]QKJ23676.1 two-component system response regulator [Poseidonibacter lekithochrous]